MQQQIGLLPKRPDGSDVALVSIYHDRAWHPAILADPPPEVPVTGTVNEHCIDSKNNEFLLARLNYAFAGEDKDKKPVPVNASFVDITHALRTHEVVINRNRRSVVRSGPEDDGFVVAIQTPSGLRHVVLQSMPSIFQDLRRMIFQENSDKPWEDNRWANNKLRRHFCRAFMIAFAMDGISLPERFHEWVTTLGQYEAAQSRPPEGSILRWRIWVFYELNVVISFTRWTVSPRGPAMSRRS